MLTYDMTKRGDYSLYEYLYLCIRADIESGAILPGQKLPSKRALALNLGVSLVTVEGAYTQLVAEGYVRSEPRRGYYAADLGRCVASGAQRGARAALPLGSDLFGGTGGGSSLRGGEVALGSSGSSRVAGLLGGKDGVEVALEELAGSTDRGEGLVADLTASAAAVGVFPYAQWAKTMRQVLSQETEESLSCQLDSRGSLRLRKALARYLQGTRGMAVSPNQLVVGAGAQTLYGMIVQLLGRGLVYAVEDPGYRRLSRIYRANDVELVHLPMDQSGVRMDELRQADPNVVHLMPSHQFPTGRVYPVSRRYELLGWAAEQPARFIVEDDFDCEFRLAGRPIPTLQSVDSQGCVIYANTFTKSLGPAFRIGYMVLPPELNRAFDEYLGFYSCTVGALDQLTLAHFIESGEYERHVNRLRSHFRKVQDALVDALQASALAPRLRLEGLDAGLHFVLHVRDERSEEELAALACEQGVVLQGIDGFRAAPAPAAPAASAAAAPAASAAAGVAASAATPATAPAPAAGMAAGMAPAAGVAAAGVPERSFLVGFGGLRSEAILPAVAALERAWA